MEEIVVDIPRNGQVVVEGKDISGPDCKTLTADLEKALGDVERVEKKPEYHRQRTVSRKAGA